MIPSMEIVPFAPDHAWPAAELFAASYARLRGRVPELPSGWADPAVIEPSIARIAGDGRPSLAALDDGALIGYLAGWLIPDPGARPWIHVPEWGLGAQGPRRRRVIDELYAVIAPAWLGLGAVTHRIGVLAGDHDTFETLDALSFGSFVVDALRSLDPPSIRRARGVGVRRAGVADARTIVALEDRLREHLASSPTYLVMPAARTRDAQDRLLVDPAVATFLAEADGGPVAFLRIGPCSDDAATIVRAPTTASITGAFTVPEWRSVGVAAALLDAALDWARAAGFERCAVDFESMNPAGSRFWLESFTPVTVVMTRTIDARAIGVA
jgi:GNAT superfamily N-acetyltransferase